MVNILALHEVNALPGVHVQYSGYKEDAFYVIFHTGRVMKFTKVF